MNIFELCSWGSICLSLPERQMVVTNDGSFSYHFWKVKGARFEHVVRIIEKRTGEPGEVLSYVVEQEARWRAKGKC